MAYKHNEWKKEISFQSQSMDYPKKGYYMVGVDKTNHKLSIMDYTGNVQIVGNVPATIHDVNCSSSFSLTEAGGWYEYSNNGNLYEYYNYDKIWDINNNIVDVSTQVLDSKLDIILKTIVSSDKINAHLHIEAYCPDPTGDIHLEGHVVIISKINEPHREAISFQVYIGEKVKQYGVKFRTKVDTTFNGNITLSNRSLLVRI